MPKLNSIKRINKPVRLCDLAYSICQPIMKKKGLMFSDLYIYWKEIVGECLSEFTWPEKLTNENGLVLYIKAKSTKLIEAQYSSSVLLDKINSFLGDNKISQIKICRNNDS